MVVAGIDYSMTSPAICIGDEEFEAGIANMFFLSQRKKFECYSESDLGFHIHGDTHLPWEVDLANCSNVRRFINLANWAVDILQTWEVEMVFLEGYAYAAKGQVFDIGECAGILKKALVDADLDFAIVPPTVIKKFACGKGNANKEIMYEAFMKENPGSLLRDLLTPTSDKVISPLSDLVDAYFICSYGISQCGVI